MLETSTAASIGREGCTDPVDEGGEVRPRTNA